MKRIFTPVFRYPSVMRKFAFLLVCLFATGSVFAASIEGSEESLEATVLTVNPSLCTNEQGSCAELTVVVTKGSQKGEKLTFTASTNSMPGGQSIIFHSGQRLVLSSSVVNGEEQISVSDLVRRPSLLWLFLLFCACVFFLGGLPALRSLLGMVVSAGVIFLFILPAILAGYPPFIVALMGSAVIMLATLLLAHGWNAKTFAALGGTALSLVITGILAVSFTFWGHLFGIASEEAVFLISELPHLDLRGLLLAGIIIGTLGSLDDVTISQASAVFELRLANSALSTHELYRRAIRIGHDHVAAAVNTLFLAYAGAALPLLLLIASNANHESWLILINRETFASEIVRTFVGSIGLIAAVPFTTLFASILAARLPANALGKSNGHGHRH